MCAKAYFILLLRGGKGLSSSCVHMSNALSQLYPSGGGKQPREEEEEEEEERPKMWNQTFNLCNLWTNGVRHLARLSTT